MRLGILVMALLGAMASAQAQTTSSGGYAAGFTLGLNINSFSSTPDLNFSNSTGLILGAQVEWKLADMFYFEPEVRYNRKGGNRPASVGSTNTLFAAGNYLEFPLLAKVKFMEGQMIRPFAMIGPNIGFKLSEDVSITSAAGNTLTLANPQTQLNTIDFAIDFRAGAEFEISPGIAPFAWLGYSLGIVNVCNIPANSWNSRGFQLAVGANFAI